MMTLLYCLKFTYCGVLDYFLLLAFFVFYIILSIYGLFLVDLFGQGW